MRMRYTTSLLLCGLLLGCGRGVPVIPKQGPDRASQESAEAGSPDRLDRARQELAEAKTPEERFYALDDAAKESFVSGKIEDAREFAEELQALTPQFLENWNYGNAVQDANLVLGRIAVQEGRIEDAKRHLIEAGKSPGSPQMNSFGPNMSLAKDLLEKGEREVVLEYFDLCRKFWELHRDRLDEWSQEVKDGKVPDFGANLVY